MIVVVSGQMAVGKTTLAVDLARRQSGEVIRIREALAAMLQVRPDDRTAMQVGGADLDRRTNGRWLYEYVAERSEISAFLVIDSVRTLRQTTPLLSRLPDTRLVFLCAHESVRRTRYLAAAAVDNLKAATPFDVAMNHPTERHVDEVTRLADSVVETDDLDTADVLNEVVRSLGLDPPTPR